MTRDEFEKIKMQYDLENRYYKKADDGCWIFTGAIRRDGYGLLSVPRRRKRPAHVVSYEIYVGPVPAGMVLDHLCRVRHCVNPTHLEPVTIGENIRRGDAGKAWGERQRAKTHCPSGHPYSPENTRIDRHGKRACLACGAAYARRKREDPEYCEKQRLARLKREAK